MFPKATLAVLACLTCATPSLADPPAKRKTRAPTSDFVRIVRDAHGEPAAMQTATWRYQRDTEKGEITVDLVGVVHIGDRMYYHALNDQLAQYDVVLYELVAPQGTRIPKGGRSKHDDPLFLVEQLVRIVLDLDFQTNMIDYTRANFVHADLSPQEILKTVEQRGDDWITLFLSVTADILRQQNLQRQRHGKSTAEQVQEIDFAALLTDPAGPVLLKRQLAKQLADDDSGAGLGPTLNTILVADRNEAVLKVLRQQLAKGKRRIAIFYGAGHMPDFEKRLQRDFGMHRDYCVWQTAWNLRTDGAGIQRVVRLLEMLQELSQ